MFPLKTLVVAVLIAIAFGPRVNACPAHNHLETASMPPVVQEEMTVATSAATEPAAPAAPNAQPADIAAVEPSKSSPAAN